MWNVKAKHVDDSEIDDPEDFTRKINFGRFNPELKKDIKHVTLHWKGEQKLKIDVPGNRQLGIRKKGRVVFELGQPPKNFIDCYLLFWDDDPAHPFLRLNADGSMTENPT